MMNLDNFCTGLQEKGVEIWIDENDHLACRDPKNALAEWEKNALEDHAPQIFRRLKKGDFISLKYPMYAGQEALWFIYKTAPDSAAYNTCPISRRIRFNVDPYALQATFQAIVNRHACLRTLFFIGKQGRTEQYVYAYKKAVLERIDASHKDEVQLRKLAEKAYSRPFNLEKEIPIRMFLISRTEKDHILLMTLHHIVQDAGSSMMIRKEFQEIYKVKVSGDDIRLPPLNHSYKEFVDSQHNRIDGPESEADLAYWKGRLAGELTPLDLPFDYPRPPVQTFKGITRFFELDTQLSEKLTRLANAHKTTLLRTLLAAFIVLLYRYSKQDDIIVGIPASIRPMPEFRDVIGYFINMLPIRADLSGEPNFDALLGQINQTTREDFRHRAYPFPSLLRVLQIDRDLSLTPVFQSAFTLYNKGLESLFDEKASIHLNHAQTEDYPMSQQEGQFDLSVSLHEKEDAFTGSFIFNTALFKKETIDRMIGHFIILLNGIADNPRQKISAVPILTGKERHKLLVEFNDTKTDYPGDKCIHQLFEEQAARTPDAVAVIYENEHLTYKELNERANRLGCYLRKSGVRPGSLVAICMERSFAMIVGLLGVLKAGGAYVPLDPDYPAERLAFMVEDAATSILLSLRSIAAKIPDTKARVIYLDEDWHLMASASPRNPIHCNTPRDPIYAMYTSGSTGKPKAAINIHQALCNRLSWMQKAYQLTPGDRVLQKTPFGFDVSGWEFFWPLLTGACFVFAKPGGHKDAAYLVRLIRKQKITILHFVPSMLQVFINEKGVAQCRSIKRVICSGEALPFKLQELFFARLDAELHNLYGPTEAAIDVTSWQCKKNGALTFVPIGYPIDNTQLYILDQQLEPVPIGVSGELHIGGAGLARGYLNRPGLTEEKFIENPFSDTPGDRLYKTGDLCRWLPDGAVEFLGRIDHQVKIRGFRIELGETETVLGAHEQVAEVVVIARVHQTGDQKLIAYITLKDRGKAPEIDKLREYLKARLPDYMIPAFFIFMDALPLFPNGKIDRKALPEPDISALGTMSDFSLPGNRPEKLLADVFKEVLGIDSIGIHDSFFDLGGDSIQSIKAIAKAREAGLDFSIEQLYQKPTVHELARVVRSTHDFSPDFSVEPFSLLSDKDRFLKERNDLDDAYPLSALQAGMVFHTEYHEDTAVYHDVFSYHIQGPPDHVILEEALRGIVNRHPVLRTSFATTGFSEVLQMVHKQVNVAVASQDLTRMSFEEQKTFIDAWIEEEKGCHIDWSNAPLLRFVMHRRSQHSFSLGLSFHHAILDGWSVASMVAELIREYQSLLKGKRASFDTVLWGFRDFVALERAAVDSPVYRNYWLQKLEDFDFLALPRWPNRSPSERIDTIANESVPVSPELFAELKNLSKRVKVPIKSVLLAAHMKVLRALAGSPDITTGLVLNGRPEQSGAEKTLGLFLNTVPFRLDLSAGTWIELVKETFKAEVGLSRFRRLPLSEIIKASGGNPIFEVIFGFNHFHVYKNTGAIKMLGGQFFERTNFPLVVNFDVDAVTSEMMLRLVYGNREFSGKQVDFITRYYINTLQEMVRDPHGRYEFHSVLSDAEKKKILVEFNASKTDYPRDKCIHQLFEAQVEKRPDAIAVVFRDKQLTYRELNRHANRLGRYLQTLGVGSESLVGICMERSIEMIMGILGILKAGGAYVPIDPGYPAERIAFMLGDSQMPVLLTQTRYLHSLPGSEAKLVCLDRDWDAIAEQSCADPEGKTAPDNPAYVIYTSGSTGVPKGTAIVHRAIAALVKNTNYIHIEPEDRISHTSNVAFDAATFEIWGALANGAALVCVKSETVLSPKKLAAFIREKHIGIMFLTTALFNRISELEPSAFAPLKVLLFGGEAVNPRWVRHVLETASPDHLLHMYGPTESTTYATWWRISHVPEGARTVPIGTPIANTRCYILDENGNPVPVGVPGELHIGGAGLARGYLNRPTLTEERFVADPFSDEPGSRLYKTGDLCRYLPDGAIEFLGRIDQQVKIRGYRIEPGEIESLLSSHKRIKEAVVIARDDLSGEKQLAAYLIAREGQKPLTPGEARKFLETKLPHYMIPAAFVMLDALRLTPNGKIDRKALPTPDFNRMREREFVAPANKTEKIIAGIWREVLSLEKISVHDNFFRIGGQSLLAVAVVSRMEEIFRRKMSIRKLFESPTISELGRHIERASSSDGKKQYHSILPVARSKPCGLSLTQQRLWYLSRLDGGINFTYNVPMSCHVKGPLDLHVVKKTLNEIVSRHDVLRTVVRNKGTPVQIFFPELTLDPPIVDISALHEKERPGAAQRIVSQEGRKPFDLTRGPFIKANILRLSDQEHILLVTVHHIIFDGWSCGVFFKEFEQLYRAFAADKPSPLPELGIQYADFAHWQKEVFSGKILKNHLAYWKKHLSGAPLLFEPPADRPRPPVQTFNGSSVRFQLHADLAGRIKKVSRESGVTLFMFLHAAFATLLFKYSRKEDIVIGTLIANRNHKQIEPLIGFFGNLLPLRADLSGDPSFTSLLKRVKKTVVSAYEHQELPFKMLLDGLGVKRRAGRPPLFQVVFDSPNVGPFGESFDIEGVTFTVSEVGVLKVTKYDLDVSMEERGGKIKGIFVYNTDLFHEATIEAMKDRFMALLSDIVANPGKKLSQLSMNPGPLKKTAALKPSVNHDGCDRTQVRSPGRPRQNSGRHDLPQ